MSRVIQKFAEAVADSFYCVRCSKRIPDQRLEALPDTRVCVACSSERYHLEDEIDLDGPLNADMVAATRDVPSGE